MIKSYLLFVFLLCFSIKLFAQVDPMISFLETPITSEMFMLFRAQNHLDNSYANPNLGLKIYTDVNRQKVKAIMVTNNDQYINNKLFSKYTGVLPYGLNFNYSFNDIKEKLDTSCTKRNGFATFTKNNVVVTIDFTDTKNMDSIRTISFRYDTLQAPQIVHNGSIHKLYVNADPSNQFKSTILNVFASAQHNGLTNLIQYQLQRKNIWNYTYTYKTKLFVPGELYNFIYAFPFHDSQLDFVSVLTESHQQIQSQYNHFESIIKSSFPEAEGWSYSYQVNREKKNAPKDILVKHPEIGTLVLDYTMSPKGVEVLYLRFLFLYH